MVVSNNLGQYTKINTYLIRVKETGQQINYHLFKFPKKLPGRGYILNNITKNETKLVIGSYTVLFEYEIDYAL